MRRTYDEYTVTYWNHADLGRRVTISCLGKEEQAEVDREEWDDWIRTYSWVKYVAASIYQREKK